MNQASDFKPKKKISYWISLLGLAVYLILFARSIACGEEWQVLNTRYLEIQYQNLDDLKRFDKKIDFSSTPGGFLSFLGSSSKSGSEFQKDLTLKVDALVQKVQLILDMRKPFKVKVKIYPDKSNLQDAYFKIYKKHANLRSWYIFEYNTIYVNVQDLFAGMLAHEIAHAIIDNFLESRPPRATAEILSRYVDEHLNDAAKTY